MNDSSKTADFLFLTPVFLPSLGFLTAFFIPIGGIVVKSRDRNLAFRLPIRIFVSADVGLSSLTARWIVCCSIP